MKCTSCVNMIPAILKGDLSENEKEIFYEHIKQCKACNDEYILQKEAPEYLKKNNSKKIYINSKKFIPIVTACIVIVLLTTFLPTIFKNYYNKSNNISTTPSVNDNDVKIIPGDTSILIHNTKSLIAYDNSISSKDINIINMINTILQDNNIASHKQELNDKDFKNKYSKKDGLLVTIYLNDVQTTIFKTSSGEISYKYNTIRIPLVTDNTAQQTIFFSVTEERDFDNPEKVLYVDSLTTKDKLTFDKLISYCNTKYTDKINKFKPYDINVNCNSFANLIENYKAKFTSSQNVKMIENSLKTSLLDFNITTKTSALKYFDELSKDSGVELLNSTINDKFLLQEVSMIDTQHYKYNLYAVCYNDKIKYCFIEQNGNYFSLNWNNVEKITGKTYIQWLNDNNFAKDTIITKKIEEHILMEYTLSSP